MDIFCGLNNSKTGIYYCTSARFLTETLKRIQSEFEWSSMEYAILNIKILILILNIKKTQPSIKLLLEVNK